MMELLKILYHQILLSLHSFQHSLFVFTRENFVPNSVGDLVFRWYFDDTLYNSDVKDVNCTDLSYNEKTLVMRGRNGW